MIGNRTHHIFAAWMTLIVALALFIVAFGSWVVLRLLSYFGVV